MPLPGGQWCGLDEARAPQNSPWENLGSALIVLCPPELSTGPGIQQVLNKSLRKEGKKEGMSHAQNPGLETSDIALGPHSKAAKRTSLDPLYRWGNGESKKEICLSKPQVKASGGNGRFPGGGGI